MKYNKNSKCYNFWDSNLNPITMWRDNQLNTSKRAVNITATKHLQEQGFKSMIV